MSKFIFIKTQDKENRFDTTKVTFEVNTTSLPELVEQFQNFLNASGFCFDGDLDFVEDEFKQTPAQQENTLDPDEFVPYDWTEEDKKKKQ